MNTPNPRLLGAGALAAILLAGCATSPGYGPSYGGSPGYGSGSACYDCGTVTRIEQVQTRNAPSATGAVLGGLVGAAAAREIAKHQTDSEGRQNTATAAGAVGGAIAGNAIQKRVSTGYNVYVRMNDGRTTVVTQSDLGGIREGSYVRVYDGRAWAQ
ncbi:glycine zipper 2TM domain-containing protein [Vulcaniibacterium tengchongense]|uniref:Outer membrane lipoprotein SlyB n=1 Tax=Vulcaniibacterium tengchongense TaxID=1273429 RepID=A0A3N4W981_9GAMM|nr:glycine zipper 2TM domain-containing protein [Vulcaniibacterium tengchongense]RPE81794.1 outer membrane lipoprotein SlyB [Vulcaniibacterium tengchongense]